MTEDLPTRIRERAIMVGRRVAMGSAESSALEELLAPYGYRPRIRDDGGDTVLVCYPREWENDGDISTAAIDDVGRAIEMPLTGAAEREWETVAEENRNVVEAVAERYGDVHVANVHAFATFMDNHRARPIAQATDADVTEFLAEYYPRNVWPSAAEAAVIEDSVRIAREVAAELL